MKKQISILILCLFLTGCTEVSANSTNTSAVAATSNKVVTTSTPETSASNVSYYFARQTPNVDKQLIKVIDSSKSTLDIAIYSLTKTSIVNSIVNAKNRGVSVRIMTDKIQSQSKSESKELAILKNANIPIKVNTHSGLLHLKMTVADKVICTTGSYNYTENATKENDEVLVIINDPKAAKDFDNEFETMWNDISNYKDY